MSDQTQSDVWSDTIFFLNRHKSDSMNRVLLYMLVYAWTLLLQNSLFLFVIHLKLELLTQFPALNDVLFDELSIYHK